MSSLPSHSSSYHPRPSFIARLGGYTSAIVGALAAIPITPFAWRELVEPEILPLVKDGMGDGPLFTVTTWLFGLGTYAICALMATMGMALLFLWLGLSLAEMKARLMRR